MTHKDHNSYQLHEVVAINIDACVEAMSNMADKDGHLIKGYKDAEEACPAEYGTEFDNFASEHGLRFSRSGEIVSANEYGKGSKNITLEKIKAAEQILIDNGIEEEEAGTVLQAIGYALLDTELYPEF
jgi:hypothetical protein